MSSNSPNALSSGFGISFLVPGALRISMKLEKFTEISISNSVSLTPFERGSIK